MGPPIPKILSIGDSSLGGIPGAIIITNADRVNNWNRKILKRFKRLVNNSEEEVLNNLIEDYYRLVNDQLIYLKERHLLKDKIGHHLYSLHLSYIRLQEKQLIKTPFYLDTMEKLLCLVCNLELEVVSMTRQKTMAFVTQAMINMLHLYLYDHLTRILHVLLKLSERYLNKQPYKLVMNLVYKYFLITVPVLNTADLNFCLHYLIYQKWKKTKHESSHSGMDKFMYFTFNKTPEAIKGSRLLRKILKPYNNETITIIDDYVNSVEANIVQYFKYFEQTKEEADNCNFQQDKHTNNHKSDDPYEMEFVQSTMYIKSMANKHSNLESLSLVAKKDEVVVIDDDDDSDVELIPMDQNEPSKDATLDNENRLSVLTPTDASNSLKPTDTSKLIPLLDSISISTIKELSSEKEDSSFNDWVLSNKAEKNLEAVQYLKTLLDDFCSKAQGNEKQFRVQSGKDTVSKEYPYSQKIDTKKVQGMGSGSTTNNKNDTSNSIEKHSKMVTKFVMQHEEAPCEPNTEEVPSIKNMLLKDVQNTKMKTKDMISSEVQTNKNVDTCCLCQHSAKNQFHNVQPHSREIEVVPNPVYKDVEIQTDNGITVTNMCNFRGAIETPPSDLENCMSPPSNSFPFIHPINEYVKEDSLNGISELYSETLCTALKFGDCSTQVYSDQLEIMQEINQEDLIKIQVESFDGFHYTTRAMQSEASTSIENEFEREMHNNLEAESQLLLINNISMDVDHLKMPLLEAELDGKTQQKEFSLPGNISTTSVNSDTSLDINNPTTTITNRKVVAAVDVKKRMSRKHKEMLIKPRKIRRDTNATFLLSEYDKFTSNPNVLADMNGVTTQTLSNQCISDSLDSSVCLKSNPDVAVRETSPSPAYEIIPTHELRKHLKDVKKKKKRGILKTSSPNINEGVESYKILNTSMQENNINISLLRSPISTRAATKRKHKTCEEDTPKCKKVNFAETDTVVHIPKEQQRRITYAVAEQAKDSMCINNIQRHDNKLIYLEPCIPISIMPFTKFLEEHKQRQINTYNKNINNIFFNKPIAFKEEPTKSTIQRIDYKKFQQNGESSLSNTPLKYSKITFRASNESANSSAGGIANNIAEFSNAEDCGAEEIFQNAFNFYTNANLSGDLDLPLSSKTYQSLTKQLLALDNKYDPINNTEVIQIEVRIPHNQSSYEKYQEKEMPIKKRKVPTSSSFPLEENDIAEDITSTEGSVSLDKKIIVETNSAFPSNLELCLVLRTDSEKNNEIVTNSENFTENDITNNSIIVTSESYKEESYPAGPVMSIAEVQENERIQNRTFKTPAERKEFPALSTFCYPTDPNTIFPESSAPIIADQFNVNNHTYNNPTINYHMGNMPLPYYNMTYYPVASYILPYNSLQLDSSSTSSNSNSYDLVKQNSTAAAAVKKENKIT